MSSRILINNIVFDADNNALIVTDENNRVVKLNQPVTRCLALLIERYPAAVPQSDFFHFVWGDEGEQIPTNALYQNISLLRRALKNASVSLSDVVITQPRFGFRLSAELEIKSIANEADTNAVSLDNEEPEASQVHAPSLPKDTEKLHSVAVLHPIKGVFYAFILIAVIFALVFFPNGNQNKELIFDTYTLATEHNGCNIYTYPDFAQNNTAEMNSYFSKFNITCKVLTQAYLSVNSARTRISVVYCDKKIDDAKTCVTHIYWNDN